MFGSTHLSMTYQHGLCFVAGVHMESGLAHLCRQALTLFWPRKGGKYSYFDEHPKFLALNHKFRSDHKRFKKGAEIKAELDALEPNAEWTGLVGYGETH
jgi:hypothetical protein